MAALAAGTSLLAAAVVGVAPSPANASSHREAPLIAADPQHDNTDTYAFVSPQKPGYVTLIANWIPFEEPNGGPNFYPFAAGSNYYINVDNNGDGLADLEFDWVFSNIDTRADDPNTTADEGTFLYNTGSVTSFDDPDLRFKQTYTLTEEVSGSVLTHDAPVAPSDVGLASMPNYQDLRNEAVTRTNGPGQARGASFAGQSDDSFFLDLRVFDLLYGADLSEVGQDTLSGYNVNSVALEVPARSLALNRDPVANPVIGVWATTERQTLDVSTGTSTGPFVQVSRLGNPLVNELVVPANLKDAFNAIEPADDATAADGQVLERVLDPELPRLIEGIYGIPAPTTDGDPTTSDEANRTDLAEIFLTGVTTALDGTGLWLALGQDTDNAPIPLDLNSQAMNADVDPAAFVPSEELRLNMSIPPTAKPSRLGVVGGDLQGFPNGRRLFDDVVDIEIQAVEGFFITGPVVALAGGDQVDANSAGFSRTFPYLALPNYKAVNASGS